MCKSEASHLDFEFLKHSNKMTKVHNIWNLPGQSRYPQWICSLICGTAHQLQPPDGALHEISLETCQTDNRSPLRPAQPWPSGANEAKKVSALHPETTRMTTAKFPWQTWKSLEVGVFIHLGLGVATKTMEWLIVITCNKLSNRIWYEVFQCHNGHFFSTLWQRTNFNVSSAS